MFTGARNRSWLQTAGIGAVVAATTLLAACGSSGPAESSAAASSGATSASGLTMWALNDQTTLKAAVDEYNSDHADQPIDLQLYANDDYKQKLRVAFGANNAPDLFFNWGGGALDEYVEAGKVDEITAADVDTSRFTPSVMATATFDDKVYGVPANGLAPVVLYYNKKVLDAAGVQPPKTWDELLAAVQTLKGQGVIPLSLAAGSKWPTLMYTEYLVDRVGGADLFSSIANGDSQAWTDPAITQANQKLVDLTSAGAFGDNASSLTYDQGASTALVYTGKAAMELMGTWEYANFKKAAPDFVASGDLGYTTFPTISGGAGDPQAIVGNPSNFLSLNSSTANKTAAMTFLKDYVLNDSQVQDYLSQGSVAPVKGLSETINASNSPDKDFLNFVYNTVNDAPTFQLSWDQALPPAAADPLLTNVDQVFLGQIPPAAFGEAMSKVGS